MEDFFNSKIIVNIENKITKLLSRNCFFLNIYLLIGANIKTKMYCDGKEVFWNNIVGDYEKEGIVDIKCDLNNDDKEENINFIIQQLFKFGLATVRNSLRLFMKISNVEIEDYIKLCLNIDYTKDDYYRFINLKKKIFEYEKNEDIYIPIVIITKCKNYIYKKEKYYEEKILENYLGNICDKSTINGISYGNIKKVPINYIITHFIHFDLYLHVVL